MDQPLRTTHHRGQRDERPSDFALSDDQHAFLEEVGALRNYLLHADARARTRLHEILTEKGLLAGDISEPDLLTADLAETIVRQADQLSP